jgi:hypothetical protein
MCVLSAAGQPNIVTNFSGFRELNFSLVELQGRKEQLSAPESQVCSF